MRGENTQISDGSAQSGKRGKKSRCPVSGKCGGCRMIDVPYAEQIARKQAVVEEYVASFGPVEPMIRMKNPDHYRNKVTSVFSYDRKRKPVCGVYRENSHEVVPVRECLLEDRRADAIVQSVFGLLPSFRIRIYNEDTGTGLLRYVQVRTAHATRQVMVTLVTADPVFPSKNNFVRALRALHPEITTIVLNINNRRDSMILGEREIVLWGLGYIEDTLCGRTFRLSSKSFYQINSIQTEKLYHLAVDAAGLSGKERVLDAYCGIGTIGIIAADRCREVISVELNPDAVQDAVRNARANGLQNIRVARDDAGAFMERLAERGESVDVLFLDPPRAGASESFLRSACRMAPGRIVYISCNPETLGRDLAYLSANGYRMKKATPVDMFPYAAASHVETVCLLSRR
ncbi:MAG: 23S rRNA (uracil(1939)-C(5))-methyltransferase RlmD [Eubacteriales bacterium]|nr:23S rRNA (uracil(1939)-C(5))-methyltransferase RlmD [Eubacteriales bacterium]